MCDKAFIDRTNETLERLEKKLDKVNGNVAANTRWRYITVGGLAVITALVIPLLLLVVAYILNGG